MVSSIDRAFIDKTVKPPIYSPALIFSITAHLSKTWGPHQKCTQSHIHKHPLPTNAPLWQQSKHYCTHHIHTQVCNERGFWDRTEESIWVESSVRGIGGKNNCNCADDDDDAQKVMLWNLDIGWWEYGMCNIYRTFTLWKFSLSMRGANKQLAISANCSGDSEHTAAIMN